jgi:hypothetical protein
VNLEEIRIALTGIRRLATVELTDALATDIHSAIAEQHDVTLHIQAARYKLTLNQPQQCTRALIHRSA